MPHLGWNRYQKWRILLYDVNALSTKETVTCALVSNQAAVEENAAKLAHFGYFSVELGIWFGNHPLRCFTPRYKVGQ